jgi:hypothetical protein
MDWLQETSGRELLVLGGGTLAAFFGWDFFRLLRLAAGGFAGALVGWGVYNLAGLPAPLAAREIDPRLWLLLLILFFGFAGYFLLRLIKTLGVFLLGAALGFICGKAVMTLLFPSKFPMVWLSPSPSEALLAAIAGGAVVLVSEKTGVILMTSFLGSYLAGSALPWTAATWVLFGVSAPLQWWIQAGRPAPGGRGKEKDS